MFFLLKLFGFKRSVAGVGYVLLNLVRVMNIVALLTVAIASIVVMLKTAENNAGFVFEATSRLITFGIAVFLIVSELPFFRGFFARNFPLLSHSSGFVFLGACLMGLSICVLGRLNNIADSEKALGLSFWQINLAAGIVTFIVGFINVIASFIFRNKKAGVTARMVRAYGATAPSKVADVLYSSKTTLPTHTPSVRTMTEPSPRHSISRDTLPSYYGSPGGLNRSGTTSTRGGLNISNPVNDNSEQFSKFKTLVDIQRPDSAAHPAFHGGRF